MKKYLIVVVILTANTKLFAQDSTKKAPSTTITGSADVFFIGTISIIRKSIHTTALQALLIRVIHSS